MRSHGLWHAGMVQLIVSMRHHDTVVIADAGLPVPPHVPTIDLGWRRREPRLLPVLGAIVAELVVERATIAEEAREALSLDGLRCELGDIPIDWKAHADLIALCAGARAVIRTGEDTPYANVILHAGVPFGRSTGGA